MVIHSQVKTHSPEFQKRKKFHRQLAQELQEKLVLVAQGGPGRKKHEKNQKLFVRKRIELLIDPGSSFLELSALASWNLYNQASPSAGIITGIGTVHGKETMIIANDATCKGGAYFPLTLKKHLRAQEIAQENHLPCLYLVDSAGAFLPLQSEVFPDREHFGRIFYHQAQMSAQGIPQIAIVMGSCTAGGAYIPALADETIIVENQGTIFLGGPLLVQAATGAIVSEEELGGARLHTQTSGVADHLAKNEAHALEMAREILAHIPRKPPLLTPERSLEAPLYDAEEIYGILPEDSKIPFDVHEIIARLVDGSRFQPFKANYGQTIVCGFTHVWGYSLGIVANNGVLFSESALKATHFIELCCQRKIPLLFLQNITGFMVGRKYEAGGIAKDGAKLVSAVANAAVPKITIIIGGSFGAGNYGMCGRAYQPRFLWMWPHSRISVMGGDQAAFVLSRIKSQQLQAQGKILTQETIEQLETPIRLQYERESSAYYSTAHLWDDGILMPSETRQVLARALSTVSYAPIPKTAWGVLRM